LKQINSFDIETLEQDKKLIPYCITCILDDKIYAFFGINCVNEFLSELKKISISKKKDKKRKIYIFSHNLSFDASIILQNSNKNDLKFNGLFFKGNIYFLEINFDGISIILKCSYRFFPAKLSSANKLLGTRKKIDFNHEKINIENFEKKKEEIINYCVNDSKIVCEIINLYNKLLSNFLKDWYIKSHSLPGLSFKIFNIIHNNFNIDISLKIEDDFLFRNSYFGGRCEIFGNPKSNELIYHFDFKGMYAQIMLDEFNFGEFEIIEKPSKINDNGFYYIEAFSDIDIPILPHKSKENNKLMFVNGFISGLFWWEEIKLFLNNGGIVLKLKYWIRFKKKEKIFEKFSSELSLLREKKKEYNSICKLIINSIYGRLGMGDISSETKLFKTDEYLKFCEKNEKRIIKENWVNDVVLVEFSKRKESTLVNSNVALASMITSKARIKLFNGFKSIIKNGGRILYSDTDSIFASFNRNVDNEKFGEIFFDTSKKDTKIKKAIFALPKAYSLIYENGEKITRIKGFNNLNIDFNEFKSIFKDKSKKKTILKTLKKSNFILTYENLEKIIFLGEYNKRIFYNKNLKTKTYFNNIDKVLTKKK
jgi:hypothetical protein